MNLECPHCTASLEIDEETRLGLEKLDTFDCPVCEKPIPSPVKQASKKAGLAVFKSLNRNLLILGSAAILVIGGVVGFLATRDPGSTTQVDRKLNEKIIHNEFFTRLVESGATTYDDLREIDYFAAYGEGYVGLSGEAMDWQEAAAFAKRLGGAVLDITVLPRDSRREMGEWLAREIPFLSGRCVWIVDQGQFCSLDAPDVLPFSEQGQFRVLVAWPAEQTWIDLGWKWVIDPKFDEVRPFSEWGFGIVRVGGKWGIIDEQGKTILEPQYDEIINFSEHGCARVFLDGMWGLVDRNGKLVVTPEWDDVQDLINGFIPVQRDGKWGYLNDKGELAIPCEWDSAWRFSPEGFAVVTRAGRRGFIDRTGKIIVEPTWDGAINFSKEGIGLVRRTGAGWGMIDTTGRILTPPSLDLLWKNRRLDLGILPHGAGLMGTDGKPITGDAASRFEVFQNPKNPFREGLARVDSESGSTFVNVNAEKVISTPGIFCRDFSNGIAAASKKGKWGFIDKTGKLVIDAVWDEVRDMENDKAAIKRSRNWGWANKDGTIISQPIWDEVRPFVNGYSAVKREDLWGFIDLNGKVVAQPQWKSVGDFSDGFASVTIASTPELLEMVPPQWIRPFESHYDPATKKYTQLPANHFIQFINSTGKIAFEGKTWFRNHLEAKSFYFENGLFRGRPLEKNSDWSNQWKFYTDTKGNLIENRLKAHDDSSIFGDLIKHFPGKSGLPYYDRHGLTGPHGHLRDAEGNDILLHIGRDTSGEYGTKRSDFLGDFIPYAEPPKYGLMDTEGNVVIPPTWDYAQIRSADRVIINMKDKQGLADGQGQVLIEPEWDELEILTVLSSTLDEDGKTLLFGKGVVGGGIGTRFLSPWVQVKRDGKSLILRDDGTPALPETMAEATYVDFYGPEHVVIKETDAEGKELRSLYHTVGGEKISFPDAIRLHYNWNTAHYGYIWELVHLEEDPVWRLRNIRGADPGHTQPGTEEPVGWGFMQDRARLHDGVGWYLIDPHGRSISPDRWEDLRDFRQSFAAVKRDGKWGFIGLDGTALTEFIYDEVLDFHEGLAGVKLDGLWGFIDPSGAIAIAPVWDEAKSFARWSGERENGKGDAPYIAVAEMKIFGAAALIGKDGNVIIDPRSPKLTRNGAAFVNGKEQLIVARENGEEAIKKRAWVNNMNRWYQREASPTRLWQHVPREQGGNTWKLFNEDGMEISQGEWNRPYYDARVDRFSQGFITARSNSENYGLLGWDGSEALEAQFERIAWVAPGVAAAWNKMEGGLYGSDGNWLFKDNDQIRIARFSSAGGRTQDEFRHGLVVIEDAPRWGYIRLNRPTTK